jgi:hypothetical protein
MPHPVRDEAAVYIKEKSAVTLPLLPLIRNRACNFHHTRLLNEESLSNGRFFRF